MSLKVLSGTEHAPLEPLLGRTVVILGFGNQGSAHALNMRDAGLEVLIGCRADSPGERRAADNAFQPLPIADATALADLLIVALPDEVQPEVWQRDIAPNLRPGAVVGFLHGFCIRFQLIEPPPEVGVVMVAPKGPGRTLRQRYEHGQGIPCLFAVHQDGAASAGTSEAIGLAWANAIGCARAAIVYTTFADETETDLFGEQTVLCGGMTGLILSAFETLVDAGYAPELAYMECCQEVKQVADLVYERGLMGMMEAISNTAEFGTYRAAPAVVTDELRRRMRQMLAEIREGRFASSLRADHGKGFPWFNAQRDALGNHPIEAAGAAVRTWMPWLGSEAR